MKIPFEEGRSPRADFVSGNSESSLPDFSIGGLKGRFASGKTKRIGRYDPFANESVTFGSELVYQNWLLRRFDTTVLDIDARREPWSALYRGKHVEVRPHLFVRWKNQPPCLEIVATNERASNSRSLEALEVVARAHGIEASVRTVGDILANCELLYLLEWALQRVCLYARHEGLQWMEKELGFLLRSSGPWNRAAVVSAARCQHNQCEIALVDAALMKLRHAGKIRLDLSSGEYGNGSIIEPIF